MRLLLILCFSVCFSCDYFEKKKLDSRTILDKELQTFEWDQVDQYPTFETCPEGIDFKKNKSCFESTLTTHISNVLNPNIFELAATQSDTLQLRFFISKNGVISIPSIKSKTLSDETISSLRTVLTESLEKLPLLYPAIKHSQQVQSEFQLPIIINLN